MLEQLEPRLMMSAAPAPVGFVEVWSGDIDATAPIVMMMAEGANVNAGDKFYAVAKGQFVLSNNSPGGDRYADAEYYQKTVGASNWDLGSTGKPLHITGLTEWSGGYQSDHVYGKMFESSNGDAITAQIIDPYHADNEGSLHVTLYQEVELESVTAFNAADEGDQQQATAAMPTSDPLDLVLTADGTYEVAFHADLSPLSEALRGSVLWELRADDGSVITDADSTDLLQGDFSTSPSYYDSTLGRFSVEFDEALNGNATLAAWVDGNGDGVQDAGEVAMVIPMQAAAAPLPADYTTGVSAIQVEISLGNAATHTRDIIVTWHDADGDRMPVIVDDVKVSEVHVIGGAPTTAFTTAKAATGDARQVKVSISLATPAAVAAGQTYRIWIDDYDHIDGDGNGNKNDATIKTIDIKIVP